MYGLLWTEQGLLTYVDSPNNTVLYVPFNQSFWQKGESLLRAFWMVFCDTLPLSDPPSVR